uniref:Fascin actin-bundling protein 2a, retinal n=1 Tax=Sinocyclocheilus anshuiensis TaxID=1608454 RepID=A0A671SJH5_9TELE
VVESEWTRKGMEKKLNFGLINCENRYFTAEAFGFKVNASGTSMKKKQIWTLEQDQDSQVVFLRSHLGRYLEVPNTSCRFLLVMQSDGRWALQSEPYSCYFGGSAEYLSCFAQTIGESELWAMHLALHPQANLLSVSRKRYARLSTRDNKLCMDSNIPWGMDSLITLVYLDEKYSLKTCDNRFLSNDGKLVMEHRPNTSFTLELKSGKLAFKDCEGKFLSRTGPTGTLKSGRCSRPGKGELFDLEESHPQVSRQPTKDMCLFVKVTNDYAFVSTYQINPCMCLAGEDEQFMLKLINRPILVLRGENGFVSVTDQGFTEQHILFWAHFCVNFFFSYTDGNKPEDFFFEFVEYGRVAIKGQNSKYLRGDQGGTLMGDGLSVDASSLWEH